MRLALPFVCLLAGAGLLVAPEFGGAQADAPPGQILAVVGRQVARLNLEAPRHQPLSRLPAANNALDVTAQLDGSHIVVAVGAAFPDSGQRGSDLLNLDPASGTSTPLLTRAEGRESLDSPAWWPDRATLLFERLDLGGQTVGAPGQEVPRYPSRIERVLSDGSGRDILIADGRQPSAAPDGTRLVFARTRNQGASLSVWSQADGSVTGLIPEGRFADVAYPQFSPRSDQIAFVAPQSGINGQSPLLPQGLEALFGPTTAYAHGIPWDPWLVNVDGTGLRRLAETGADEPSVAWSPDATRVFVFSGTGSYIVDVVTGELAPLSFVQGYGELVWVN